MSTTTSSRYAPIYKLHHALHVRRNLDVLRVRKMIQYDESLNRKFFAKSGFKVSKKVLRSAGHVQDVLKFSDEFECVVIETRSRRVDENGGEIFGRDRRARRVCKLPSRQSLGYVLRIRQDNLRVRHAIHGATLSSGIDEFWVDFNGDDALKLTRHRARVVAVAAIHFEQARARGETASARTQKVHRRNRHVSVGI